MSKWFLLAMGALFAVLTPALAAEDPPVDPDIVKWQGVKARAEAREAAAKAQQAEIEARLAPLTGFGGTGATTASDGGGTMEAAYLAAVSMRSVALAIDRRVGPLLPADAPQGQRVMVMTAADTFTFDRIVAFETETNGLVAAFNTALDDARGTRARSGARTNCSATATSEFRGPGFAAPAVLGAVANLLQTETTITGFNELGDADMLINALVEANGERYVLHKALIEPRAGGDPGVNALLAGLDRCETAARARIGAPPIAAPAKARLEALLARSTALRDRLTTASDTGTVPLAEITRQAQLRANSPYVLRVEVERAGGTMITRKNIWTALGAPSLIFSGGVIARFSLADRSTGAAQGGMITCRAGQTGLRAALRLRVSDIICADQGANGRASAPVTLDYDREVFQPQVRAGSR